MIDGSRSNIINFTYWDLLRVISILGGIRLRVCEETDVEKGRGVTRDSKSVPQIH